MNSYFLKRIDHIKYNYVAICLNYEKFISYYKKIEEEIVNETGTLLVDQLLITGDNSNRFIEFNYKNGIIDINSVQKGKVPCDLVNCIEKQFKQFVHEVKSSILPESVKKRLLT